MINSQTISLLLIYFRNNRNHKLPDHLTVASNIFSVIIKSLHGKIHHLCIILKSQYLSLLDPVVDQLCINIIQIICNRLIQIRPCRQRSFSDFSFRILHFFQQPIKIKFFAFKLINKRHIFIKALHFRFIKGICCINSIANFSHCRHRSQMSLLIIHCFKYFTYCFFCPGIFDFVNRFSDQFFGVFKIRPNIFIL